MDALPNYSSRYMKLDMQRRMYFETSQLMLYKKIDPRKTLYSNNIKYNIT